MKIGKWFVASITLTLALATAGAVTAFAMVSDGNSDNLQILDSDPTYDQWVLDFGDGIGDGKVVTSIDDIDLNVCNYIHNINTCTAEELDERDNLKAISWIVDPQAEVESEPSPPLLDGEPMYEVQSHEEAVEQDCDLAGGTLQVSYDDEVWCVFAHDLEEGAEGDFLGQPPAVLPEHEPLTAN